MTMREFYEAIVNGEEITEDIMKKAQDSLTALNLANEKRKSAQTAKKVENDAIKEKILAYMKEKKEPVFASEVGNEIGISTQKASALLLQLKAENLIANGEKVKRITTYILTSGSEGEESNSIEEEEADFAEEE